MNPTPLNVSWTSVCSVAFIICAYVLGRFWRAYSHQPAGVTKLAASLLVAMSAGLTSIIFGFVFIGAVAILQPPPPQAVIEQQTTPASIVATIVFILSAVFAVVVSIAMLVINRRLMNLPTDGGDHA